MKIVNAVKNWWNPWGYEKKSRIFGWKLDPKEDITAYELFRCNTHPISVSYPSAISFQEAINKWYGALPENCRRHLKFYIQDCIEFCKYGE